MFTSIVHAIFISVCVFNHAESTHFALPDPRSYITHSSATKYFVQESYTTTPREHRLGSVQDIDGVISHFLNFTHYLRYFKSNFYHIKNTWLKGYPEYESYHYIVQAMIYANIESVVAWEEVNSLFMIFSRFRPILEWKVDSVSLANNTFDPCKWYGIQCDKLSTLQPENWTLQQIYPNLYISDLEIQIPIFYAEEHIPIYLNYSLPRHLETLLLGNAIIYHFKLRSMPKRLEKLVIVNCEFAQTQNGDFSFEWNSIPSQLTTLRILRSTVPPKFWTSERQKNFSTINNATLFMHSWFKPKLQLFVIKDCPTFENDPTSLNMHQFVSKIHIMAPNLCVLTLENLKLHGILYTSDFYSKTKYLAAMVSFVKSGMDIIGSRRHANAKRTDVRSLQNIVNGVWHVDETQAEKEYNEYRSLTRYLENQQRAQEYANGSELLLSDQDVDYILTKFTTDYTLNNDSNTSAILMIQHWVENPAAFLSAKYRQLNEKGRTTTEIGIGLTVVTGIMIGILVILLRVIDN